MKKVVHISPSLPPAINGLGDFCHIVARNLERSGYTDNVFVLRRQATSDPGRDVRVFNSKTFYGVLSEMKADVVVLHYVGYAYDRDGLPFYLVNGLKKYKNKVGCRLLVFFHELYASSASPFELPFYTSRLQQLIVNALWQLADKTFTSCRWYQERLQDIVGVDDSRKTECTGIFSNVPDELYDPQIPKEEHSMLVFGSARRRNAVYDHRQFPELVKKLRIEKVYDVGPGTIHCDATLVEVLEKGALGSGELAVYLNAVKYGALSYKPKLLAKSGIFSAYAAFGVIPFNLTSVDEPLYDGLVEGKNYFSMRAKFPETKCQFDIARKEILKWYRDHDQSAVTQKLKACL